MSISSKQKLRSKYKAMDPGEKQMVAESLMKVNLGVAMPIDLKRAASFLRGTEYIAKTGLLDSLLNYLHGDDETTVQHSAADDKTIVSESIVSSETVIKGLKTYSADQEVTEKKKS
ncbi:hypothetical protein K1X76_11965 [bacterium]|nr:hypothetical protein [bacterium]